MIIIVFHGQVSDGNSPIEFQPCLKKCSNTPKSSVNMTEFCTPGSSVVKGCACETPKSRHGSSLFSPGEAFWNEAIQLADGLCVPMVNFSAQATEETNIVKTQFHIMNSCNFRNGVGHNKSKGTLDEGENRARQMELSTSLGSLVKHTKDLDKEVSLLPVKHFDFSCEDKNLDESTPPRRAVDDSECATHIGGEQSECGAVDHKGIETSNIFIRCGKAQTDDEIRVLQEMTSVLAVTKGKVDILCPETDCMTSNSPVNEIKNSILKQKSDEASTPSSFVLLEDRLDLNRWLPPEICSIYRKKGILKLYPWQVTLIV
jgi:DNA polymerase theta